MKTTVKVREKFQVTIPEDVRSKISLKVGERVEVFVRGDEIIIRPVMEIPKKQEWFWTNEWQDQVVKSMKEIEKGNVKVFKNVKEARKHFGD